MGGGRGGGAPGATSPLEGGIGGAVGGGGGAEPEATGVDGLPTAGDLGLSSMADRGRGGAIVPKRIEASCFALPPVGLSSPSPSEELSSVESMTDHSSSSGRCREGRGPVWSADSGGSACGLGVSLSLSCRWLRR